VTFLILMADWTWQSAFSLFLPPRTLTSDDRSITHPCVWMIYLAVVYCIIPSSSVAGLSDSLGALSLNSRMCQPQPTGSNPFRPHAIQSSSPDSIPKLYNVIFLQRLAGLFHLPGKRSHLELSFRTHNIT
jgi:hypothetical protein